METDHAKLRAKVLNMPKRTKEDAMSDHDQPYPGAKWRVHDPGLHIGNFRDEILVICLKCGQGAEVRSNESHDASVTRVTCGTCGYNKQWERGSRWEFRPETLDPFFGLSLRLQVPCCGEVLWAYNARHLQFLKDWIGADLRERTRAPESGWSNQSLASRLPRWMVLARNREEVMRAIGKLEKICGSKV